MAGCRGNLGSVEGTSIKHLNLFFLHHLLFHYSSYLKSIFSLQMLVLLLVIYIGNALWDLFCQKYFLNGFSFFLGLYCQVPHLTYVIGLLNILGKFKYMGGVITNTSSTLSASLRCLPDLLFLQLFLGFQSILAEETGR